jgi:hypothetical protein
LYTGNCAILAKKTEKNHFTHSKKTEKTNNITVLPLNGIVYRKRPQSKTIWIDRTCIARLGIIHMHMPYAAMHPPGHHKPI